MSLVRQNLENGILSALKTAVDQGWTLQQVAAAWANAIHSYVSAAEVQGVSSSVSVNVPITGHSPEHGSGTATQTGSVNIT